MIPNFSTYLKESVWGNISKRAEGSVSRKEDDINNLDIDELCNYIKDKYEFITNDTWPIYVGRTTWNEGRPYLYVLLFYGDERKLPNIPAHIYFNPIDI